MMQIQLEKTLQGADGPLHLQVDMQLHAGEGVALYGASGAGKTTLLRCISGLTPPDRGQIIFAGQTWYDHARNIVLPPQQRRVGLMFQDYALFPHLTVRGNIAFALAPGARASRVDELLDMMGLSGLQHQRIATLSGGQKQRVALARTLAAEPQLLLLDEPLSALDTQTRQHLQQALKHLQQRLGLTVLLVSHDVSELFKLTDRVLLLQQGRIIRDGPPAEVFASGNTSGKVNLTGEVLAITPVEVMVALTVRVGQQIVRVVVMPDEAAALQVGDAVALISKAFHPMVMKLDAHALQPGL